MIKSSAESIQAQSHKDRIKDVIRKMVKTAWDDNQIATLVSHIGSKLVQEYDLKKDLEGLKLAEFIKKELHEELSFIDSPKDSMIKALVPADAKINEDTSAYFPSSKFTSDSELVNFKRIDFDRSIWKAFSSPLQEGSSRHIRIEPSIIFEDNETPHAKPEHFIILKELIVPKDSMTKVDRDIQIQKNILKWVTDNSIDIEKVKLPTLANRDKSSNFDSVFSLLIKSLDDSDVKRVVIPLDIILKLQNKRV
jgi:hypothetical protein